MASRSSSTRTTNGSAERYVLLFMSCPSCLRAPLRRAVPSLSIQSSCPVLPSTAVSVLFHNLLCYHRRSRWNTKRSLLTALVTTHTAQRPPRQGIRPPAARVTTPMCRHRRLPRPPLRPLLHTASTTPTRLTGTLLTQLMPILSTHIPPRPTASRLTPIIYNNNLTTLMPSSITSE